MTANNIVTDLKQLNDLFPTSKRSASFIDPNTDIRIIREANRRHDAGEHMKPAMNHATPPRLSNHKKAWVADDVMHVYHNVKVGVASSYEELATHLGRAPTAIECFVKVHGRNGKFGRDFNEFEIADIKSRFGQEVPSVIAARYNTSICDIFVVAISGGFYHLNNRCPRHLRPRYVTPPNTVQQINNTLVKQEKETVAPVSDFLDVAIAERDALRKKLEGNPIFAKWVKLNSLIATYNKE